MHKLPFRRLLLLSPLLFALPLHASELKFTAPGDATRSLDPVVAPSTLSVVNEEGGFLRFRSEDKMRFCQMNVAPGGTVLLHDSDRMASPGSWAGSPARSPATT